VSDEHFSEEKPFQQVVNVFGVVNCYYKTKQNPTNPSKNQKTDAGENGSPL